ncbi:hypothetical protein [Carboxylicivirga taeanensis]|uniref:hypothetical protein n=1 Tax=Carboxylicivirga taeanensis TaxID=1416875 RepID=UPI003F6DC4E3
MEQDIYKRFVEKVKSQPPQLFEAEVFKRELLMEIAGGSRRTKKLLLSLRVAASILILISLGAYVWMEVDTWEQRLLAEQKPIATQVTEAADWSCRQTIDRMMDILGRTQALVVTDNSVAINKKKLHQLKAENREAGEMLEGVLVYMKQFNPSDYEAFQSGETVRLTAWMLRKEYDVCSWLTNN